MADRDTKRLAVLIDADNATASVTSELMAEIAKYGTPTIRRAYGDWTTQNLAGWKDQLLRHAIQPIQQFAYTRGKNATDSSLIIDAMDVLYADNVDGFAIVSSDSDFTRLATRLRESGKTVYGLGRRDTPDPFVKACDRFIYLDLLGKEPAQVTSRRPRGAHARRRSAAPRRSTAGRCCRRSGRYLTSRNPGFDTRDYGLPQARRARPRPGLRRGQRRCRCRPGTAASRCG